MFNSKQMRLMSDVKFSKLECSKNHDYQRAKFKLECKFFVFNWPKSNFTCVFHHNEVDTASQNHGSIR